MKPLTLSLEVNGIEVKEIIAIYDSDDLEAPQLEELTGTIIKTLEKL